MSASAEQLTASLLPLFDADGRIRDVNTFAANCADRIQELVSQEAGGRELAVSIHATLAMVQVVNLWLTAQRQNSEGDAREVRAALADLVRELRDSSTETRKEIAELKARIAMLEQAPMEAPVRAQPAQARPKVQAGAAELKTERPATYVTPKIANQKVQEIWPYLEPEHIASIPEGRFVEFRDSLMGRLQPDQLEFYWLIQGSPTQVDPYLLVQCIDPAAIKKHLLERPQGIAPLLISVTSITKVSHQATLYPAPILFRSAAAVSDLTWALRPAFEMEGSAGGVLAIEPLVGALFKQGTHPKTSTEQFRINARRPGRIVMGASPEVPVSQPPPPTVHTQESVMAAYAAMIAASGGGRGEPSGPERVKFESTYQPRQAFQTNIASKSAIQLSTQDERRREANLLWIVRLDDARSLALLAPEAYRVKGGDSGDLGKKSELGLVFDIVDHEGPRLELTRPAVLKPWNDPDAALTDCFAIVKVGEIVFQPT